MLPYQLFIKFLYLTCFWLGAFSAGAADIVNIVKGQSAFDTRNKYTDAVLRSTLEQSTDKYGPYVLNYVKEVIPTPRISQFLADDHLLNVAIALTNKEWERDLITIRIPIRKGLLNYRLLLINRKNSDKFKNIKTVEDLKKLSVGLRKTWVTHGVMSDLGFSIVDAFAYDAIFSMLQKQRFDYIPRGIYEIYDELEARKELTDLMIEPNLALHIPAPIYMFVSPAHPRIAKRLEYGLNKMVVTGRLNQIFDDFYGDLIKRAQLHKRLILEVGNQQLPEKTPIHDKSLWIDILNQQK
ncbi:hypothetical protein XM47_01540 [Catenovulum maritimum]|uniref:Uncharacterized protein n=1 Tax=Catenovulum maritimum TaxID=1513271 RepID=A0A0J8GVL2_9ALTE|nr:hypothetical protein XM47_01540 [Catenovulum maritimum]